MLPDILLGSLGLLHVCVPVSVSEAQVDESGKRNEVICSWYLLARRKNKKQGCIRGSGRDGGFIRNKRSYMCV